MELRFYDRRRSKIAAAPLFILLSIIHSDNTQSAYKSAMIKSQNRAKVINPELLTSLGFVG